MIGRVVAAVRRGLEIVGTLLLAAVLGVTQHVALALLAGVVVGALLLILFAPLVVPLGVARLTGYRAFDGKSFVGGGLYVLALLGVRRLLRSAKELAGREAEEGALRRSARWVWYFALVNAGLWVFFKVHWTALIESLKAGE